MNPLPLTDITPDHPRLPKNAVCVWSGEVMRMWTWEQAQYDGSTHTYEIAQVIDGAYVLPVLADGRVLLVREWHAELAEPFYGLPGGKLDWGETPEEAVARELEEETGYRATSLRLVWRKEDQGKLVRSEYLFIAQVEPTGKPPKEAPNERVEVWLGTVEEAAAIIARDDFRIHYLRSALRPAVQAGELAGPLRQLLAGE